MQNAISDLDLLLASMEPVLNPVEVAYVTFAKDEACPFDLTGDDVIGTFREAEGLTAIVVHDSALRAGVPIVLRAAWITLTVHSDLEAVGLTAAFATAIGDAGISCNVVAAAYHDHIFVPSEAAGAAMAALRRLQAQSAGRRS